MEEFTCAGHLSGEPVISGQKKIDMVRESLVRQHRQLSQTEERRTGQVIGTSFTIAVDVFPPLRLEPLGGL